MKKDLEDNNKRSNICMIRVPERKERMGLKNVL